MKAAVLIRDKKYNSRNDKSLGIQTFGDNNDYPQIVSEIVDSSATGKPCLNIYTKFIKGKGFADSELYKKELNKLGQTSDYILSQICNDYAKFNGFYLHVNYNANYKIVEIYHVPFETVRLGQLDDEGVMTKFVKHWDWGRRMSNLRKWSKEDIIKIDVFNTDPQKINDQIQEAGGWNEWKGQMLMFSGSGDMIYPLPVYDQELTDMSTEDGLSNISYRNARCNFLMSGAIVVIDNKDQSDEQESETKKSILQFQGDEEAASLLYLSVESKEEVPEFISFTGKNFDKDFTVTTETVKNKIGRSFIQPPILRGEDVGSNFGADSIKNAYDFYNSITESERLNIEAVFAKIFNYWNEPVAYDFTISPLEYTPKSRDLASIPLELLNTLTTNEKRALLGYDELVDTANNDSLLADKIGIGGTQNLLSIQTNDSLAKDQKIETLKLLFSLTDDQAKKIVP